MSKNGRQSWEKARLCWNELRFDGARKTKNSLTASLQKWAHRFLHRERIHLQDVILSPIHFPWAHCNVSWSDVAVKGNELGQCTLHQGAVTITWCSFILKCLGQLPAYSSVSWGRRRENVAEKRSEGARQKGELLDVLNAFTWFHGFVKWEAAGQDSK